MTTRPYSIPGAILLALLFVSIDRLARPDQRESLLDSWLAWREPTDALLLMPFAIFAIAFAHWLPIAQKPRYQKTANQKPACGKSGSLTRY